MSAVVEHNQEKIKKSATLAASLGVSYEAFSKAMNALPNTQQGECIIIRDDHIHACEVAKDFDVGLSLHRNGQINMTFFVKSFDGDEVAVPVSLDSAMRLVEIAAKAIEAKVCEGSVASHEVSKKLKDTFGFVVNLDQSQKIFRDLKLKFEADELVKMRVLQEQAEDRATKKVASQIRRMASALTISDSVERHALIDDLAPFIRKAYEF